MVKIVGSAFDLSYRRTTPYPIDASSVFNTIEEARAYARNNDTETYVPYAGQIISVLENGTIYKLVKDESIIETDSRKHYKLAIIGSNNDNDERYVRKDIAETIKFLMTFLEGVNVKGVSTLEEIKLLKNIVSQNFSNGSTGFGIFQDEQGNYHLDIDFVNIRRKLTVEEIQVQRTYYVAGKQYNTPGGGIICSAVEDTGAAWRCRFKTTDAEGRTVHCTFKEDDQAICETFNLTKKEDGKPGNRFYWRRVVGTGNDYIDLSKDGSGSDVPRAGDEIVQLGHRTDVTRQGANVLDSVTPGGPYIRIYQGINSYNLPQPKIDLNPTESIIKAKFISEATGKDIDRTLDDMKVNLDLIKSQTDKEYTLWFFDYIPTLTNIPASEWITHALKTMHEQDMFYNRATGLAYRFEKSGSTWVWNNITDQQTVKALENAAKAQNTADGKKRVFVEQPTAADAYDVGDMWVNATYPSAKPYTYQNDSLVCKVAKNAGTAFEIAHWQSSSTATTAYLENLGDRIIAGVADAENKAEAIKKLAEDGIASATGLANDAVKSIQGVVGDMGEVSKKLTGLSDNISGVNKTLTQHTTAIQATNESIALLAQGKQKDESGNVVNISKSGLVTTAYFNSLFSERVEFDKDGHIKDVSKAGLVTTADFFELFASKKDQNDGYVSTAYISGFIKEEENGTYLSNIIIGADLIRFNGKVVANDTFVVDEEGNLTLNNITAKNGVVGGWTIHNNGLFCSSSDVRINVDISDIDFIHFNSGQAAIEISTSNLSRGCLKLDTHSGYPAIDIEKKVLMTKAIKAFGGVEIEQGDNDWNTPGCLMAMTINGNDKGALGIDGWNGPINKGQTTRLGVGKYKITHNLGHNLYVPMAIAQYTNNSGNGRCNYIVNIVEKTSTYFTILVNDNKDNVDDCTIYVTMFGLNSYKYKN